MLTTDNYIAFFTVCGFFSGLIFSIIKELDPVMMLVYSLLITFAFYLFIHIVVMNFIDARKSLKSYFDKNMYETMSDYFINELALRERRIERLLVDEKNDSNTLKMKTTKNATLKTKAA